MRKIFKCKCKLQNETYKFNENLIKKEANNYTYYLKLKTVIENMILISVHDKQKWNGFCKPQKNQLKKKTYINDKNYNKKIIINCEV